MKRGQKKKKKIKSGKEQKEKEEKKVQDELKIHLGEIVRRYRCGH